MKIATKGRTRTGMTEDKRSGTENLEMKTEVAILQLCDGASCLIIQLSYLDSLPESLLEFRI